MREMFSHGVGTVGLPTLTQEKPQTNRMGARGLWAHDTQFPPASPRGSLEKRLSS